MTCHFFIFTWHLCFHIQFHTWTLFFSLPFQTHFTSMPFKTPFSQRSSTLHLQTHSSSSFLYPTSHQPNFFLNPHTVHPLISQWICLYLYCHDAMQNWNRNIGVMWKWKSDMSCLGLEKNKLMMKSDHINNTVKKFLAFVLGLLL